MGTVSFIGSVNPSGKKKEPWVEKNIYSIFFNPCRDKRHGDGRCVEADLYREAGGLARTVHLNGYGTCDITGKVTIN